MKTTRQFFLPRRNGGNSSAFSQISTNSMTRPFKMKITRGKYIGTFRISHYCPCSTCNGGYSGTASGAPLTPWVSIAVDPSVIPLGSTVYIDGYGEFKAHDTGSAIKGNRIDVCVGSHSEAYRLGVVYRDVYVK